MNNVGLGICSLLVLGLFFGDARGDSCAERASKVRTIRTELMVVLAIFLVVIVAAIASHFRPADEAPNANPGRGVVRVVAANIDTMNRDPERLASKLISMNPNIVVLLERSVRGEGNPGQQNIALRPFKEAGYEIALDQPRVRPGTHGASLLIRGLPISAARLEAAPWSGPCRIPLVVARLQSPEIAVIGIHAPPPIPDCHGTNRSALLKVASMIENGRLRSDFGPAQKGDPVIIAGDLNAFPWHPAVLEFWFSGLSDGYSRVRFPPGPTFSPFPKIPKFVRLDYVFGPSDASFTEAWIVDLPGSDHRGVVVDIQFRSDG